MEASQTPNAPLPAVANTEVLEGRGTVWKDGWTSADVAVTCTAKAAIDRVELVGWNPDWSAVAAGNVVTLRVDDLVVSTAPLAMGEKFELSIDRKIAAGARFHVAITSAAARPPDPLDSRERAFVLNSLTAVLSRQSRPEAEMEPRYLSPFGGFWTDTHDSAGVLAALRDEAKVTVEEECLLRFWIENGYAIVPGALGPAEVARTQAAVDRMIDSGSREMTYWASAVKQQHAACRDKLGADECKVLDVHAFDPDVQAAIFAPKIARFLELVMRSKAIAFQTLYFEYGSQQDMHQDTAFVYVDPALEFVASWIALERVEPGCGELQFHPGSHRLPDKTFGAPPRKALYGSDPEAPEYSRSLVQRCVDAGLPLESFLPNAGDVLFWAADLVHGGAPRVNARTRRSLVTHYCPIGRRPPYAGSDVAPTVVVDGHTVLSAT